MIDALGFRPLSFAERASLRRVQELPEKPVSHTVSIDRRRALMAVAGLIVAAGPLARAQTEAIRIGVSAATQLPLGRDCVDSVQLAIEEINARGGVLGRRLEMIATDESGSPDAAVNAVRKLTDEVKADVLIGGHASAATLAQLPAIVHARTIFIGVAGAAPAITQGVGKDYERYRYVFRSNPINAAHQAHALSGFVTGYVLAEAGLKRLAFLGEDAKWVQDLLPILARTAAAAGGLVRLTDTFAVDTTDFSAVLEKVRESSAQFLVLVASQAATDMLVRQWYDRRMPFGLGGIDVNSAHADFFDRADGKAISQIVASLAPRVSLTPKTLSYWDAFLRKSGGRAPEYTGPGAYDAVYLYAEAVRRAKSTLPEAVIAELERTDYVGVMGRIQFDENHDVCAGPGLVGMSFVQWQERGERVVVWPRELRNGRAIQPPWLKR